MLDLPRLRAEVPQRRSGGRDGGGRHRNGGDGNFSSTEDQGPPAHFSGRVAGMLNVALSSLRMGVARFLRNILTPHSSFFCEDFGIYCIAKCIIPYVDDARRFHHPLRDYKPGCLSHYPDDVLVYHDDPFDPGSGTLSNKGNNTMDTADGSPSSTPPGVIIGALVAALVLFALLFLLAAVVIQYRRNRGEDAAELPFTIPWLLPGGRSGYKARDVGVPTLIRHVSWETERPRVSSSTNRTRTPNASPRPSPARTEIKIRNLGDSPHRSSAIPPVPELPGEIPPHLLMVPRPAFDTIGRRERYWSAGSAPSTTSADPWARHFSIPAPSHPTTPAVAAVQPSAPSAYPTPAPIARTRIVPNPTPPVLANTAATLAPPLPIPRRSPLSDSFTAEALAERRGSTGSLSSIPEESEGSDESDFSSIASSMDESTKAGASSSVGTVSAQWASRTSLSSARSSLSREIVFDNPSRDPASANSAHVMAAFRPRGR
ncbi:hypothetical protein BDK51DRAFT_46534 [Blyttiomyces helicus]|uniref:Uncharacterized protein n=1 Tax=Blyttiomyces helicus TaxID=388810 RepID=A0A4P9WHV3_9FUNG|nr:hypothetical protein BDK51DRAFT_46534 [Blyttiomyces helicus]|eukprot:RKO90126.1 hypothetical protein BDK51DRAFT_46534 [Blyttiomyces helicus]